MKTVRFTEHIPEIFGFDEATFSALSNDYHKMQEFINRLKNEAVPGMDKTYRFAGNSELYIKLEEITKDNTVLGVVVDVTEDTLKLKQAETERDYDVLTGLYNRRGLKRMLDKIFDGNDNTESGALIMIVSDNMKGINDFYGHSVGNLYLKKLAEENAAKSNRGESNV